jgi:D-alanyl-D-alanine carboxypeptidase
MRNHNHLLGVVGGVDGIKTGYTRSSGFNLVTSVHRDGRYIVAVVLGGHTASERDARMRELIDAHIRDASLRRTVPAIAAKPEAVPSPSSEPVEARSEPKPVVSAKASEASSSSRTDLASSGHGHRGRSHSTPVGEDDHLSVCARPRCGGGDVGHSRSLTVCRRLTV